MASEESEPVFSIVSGIPRASMVSTDLLDARRAVEATGLAIPTDFDSPLQGVRLLAELLKMLTCFPECDKIMREQISLLYPQNWPSEDN